MASLTVLIRSPIPELLEREFLISESSYDIGQDSR